MIILGTHWAVLVNVTHALRAYNEGWNRTIIKLSIVLLIEVVMILIFNKITRDGLTFAIGNRS